MGKKVFALHCHPDDIEFMMAGTLFLLKEQGCELHYMNMANGCYGSAEYSKEETIQIRREEAKQAASFLGAEFYDSLADDLDVFYTPELIKKTMAVIRGISPDILLLPSPEEYMEDHMNTCRIGITAAFCRGMPNYISIPRVPAVSTVMAVYHSMPYGLTDGLRRKIVPDFYVDIESVVDKKTEMLGFHKSQKEWLDKSQGIDSYLTTMQSMSGEMGKNSGKYRFAEGWRRHSHLGFSSKEILPLEEILKYYRIDRP
ncbi:MAG: PIG-L family deacetylase [Spirochaetaceae bacterium]|nr:PIG-L family deacetylase [Spirochaetaceae bacterium]